MQARTTGFRIKHAAAQAKTLRYAASCGSRQGTRRAVIPLMLLSPVLRVDFQGVCRTLRSATGRYR